MAALPQFTHNLSRAPKYPPPVLRPHPATLGVNTSPAGAGHPKTAYRRRHQGQQAWRHARFAERVCTAHSHNVERAQFATLGGAECIVSVSWDHTVAVCDAESNTLLWRLTGPGEFVTSLLVCDSVIVAGSLDDALHVWRVKSNEETGTTRHQDPAHRSAERSHAGVRVQVSSAVSALCWLREGAGTHAKQALAWMAQAPCTNLPPWRQTTATWRP